MEHPLTPVHARARRGFVLALGMGLALGLAGCASAPPTGQTPAPPPPPQAVPKRAPVVGLALGGGAARGFAHVGVIQVLEEAGIRPQLVVGTSAGSLVATLYASGKNGAQLQQVAESMEEGAITDWTLPLFNRGLLRGEALARFVNAQVKNRLIEDMPMTLGIVATDLNSGQGVVFRRGDAGTAVRASSAVPAVFLPVKIGDHEYVDGGLVAPVPVRYARDMGAELVIAVDISSIAEGNQTSDQLQVLLQTFTIMGKSINAHELRNAEVVVRPALSGSKSTDFAVRKKVIEAGRQAMLQALPQLRQALVDGMR